MVPGEIFHNPLPRRLAHPLDDFRMPVEMFDRRRDGINIARANDDSFDAIADNVAGFAGRDHWQTTSGRFVNGFRAAFEAGWKDVNRSLTEIIFEIAFKTEDTNIPCSEFLQMWFGLIVNLPEQPK